MKEQETKFRVFLVARQIAVPNFLWSGVAFPPFRYLTDGQERGRGWTRTQAAVAAATTTVTPSAPDLQGPSGRERLRGNHSV